MSDLEFRCRGCGTVDTIVAVSAPTRIKGVRPDGEGGIEWKDVPDTTFDEGEADLGYGCENENCEFWQGNYGVSGNALEGQFHMKTGPTLDGIAEIVRPIEVTVPTMVTETEYVAVDG